MLAVLLGALLLATTVTAAGAVEATPVVDDPLLRFQWQLEDTRTLEAWSLTTGSPSVTVAVVDTGVEITHLDLTEAGWTGGFAGSVGFDYLRSSLSTYVSPEEDWHGTAVAGVVAARADDGHGIAGVAPDARVMVRRIYASPDLSTAPGLDAGYGAAAQAIRESVDDGADVLVLTWGGTTSDLEVFRAIRDSGVPVVAAAGNDGVDLDARGFRRFPASYELPNLVTVAATDRTGALLDNGRVRSNHGQVAVDLAAPGVEIVSLLAGGGHRYFEGTSFAAPQVAGALALGRSLAPAASSEELVGALLGTARMEPALAGKVATGGTLDVTAFLEQLVRPACTEDLPEAAFADVRRTSVHARNVDCVAAYGVARGVAADRYDPASMVIRGQMATFLARAIASTGRELPSGDGSEFPDVTDTVHAASIEAVAALGIAQGREDGTFGSGDPVTRGQMTTFLVRTVALVTATDPVPSRPWFEDTDEHPHERSILVARDLQITLGGTEPRRFDPDRPVTRVQMASFVARTLDAVARQGVDLGFAVSE